MEYHWINSEQSATDDRNCYFRLKNYVAILLLKIDLVFNIAYSIDSNAIKFTYE